MIVISFVLVVAAFVLLVVGLVLQAVVPVYACIGTAVVAGIFLAIGVLQRRHDDARPVRSDEVRPVSAGQTAGGSPDAEPTAPISAARPTIDRTRPSAEPRPAGEQPAQEQLGEEQPAEEPLAEDEGPAEQPRSPQLDDLADDEEWDDEELEYGGTVFIVEGRPRYHTEDCRYVRDRDDVEAIDVLDAVEEGFTCCGVCRPDEVLAEMKAELEAEQASASASAAATAASTAPSKSSPSVVVIPDRDKFHRADCRYVRANPEAATLTRVAARRRGYSACGLCKP